MIFTLIGIALVALIAFALYQGSSLQKILIEKTITINAPKEKVFDLVKYLKNFPKWSPFLVQDPSQKYEVKGIDGAVGAQYYWEGNKGKDLGYQEIVKINDQTFIGKKCDIQKPFVAQPTFEYYFSNNGNTVEVKEVFQLQSGLINAVFLWIFGAKAAMEKTNQQGLDLLKKAAEN
jgi:uncharacterized membrane protein